MTQNSRQPGFFGSLVVIAIGVVFVIAGQFVHRSYSPYPEGITTTGTITDVRTGRGNGGKTMYTAVYTFTTTDGSAVSFEDPASGSNRPALGTHVTVSYETASPGLARRVPGFDWFGWLVTGMGCLVVLLGLLHLLRSILRTGLRVMSLGIGWRNGGDPLP